MMEYRPTVNLPGVKRGETAWFPETPRTAILVQQGILIPVKRREGFEPPVVDEETVTAAWDDPPLHMPVTTSSGPPKCGYCRGSIENLSPGQVCPACGAERPPELSPAALDEVAAAVAAPEPAESDTAALEADPEPAA